MLPQNVFQKSQNYLLDLTKRFHVYFVRGEGPYLYDEQKKKYLDFLCGVAVTSLGHAHPEIAEVICKQATTLLHVSNWFYNKEQAELAEKLVQLSFPAHTFFFNSGTEANEAAFKLCRSYGQKEKNGAIEILSLENSFHGRTTASICLTGQKKIHSGFGPLLPGHSYIPANDRNALKKVFQEKSSELCGFFLELIQGESGIRPLDLEYVAEARELCEKHNVLLVIDEVQTGIGRTGTFFCYEQYGITPDIVTLAKALGNGLPLSAILVKNKFSQFLSRGQHGTTMGGNLFCTRVGLEVIRIIERDKILDNVLNISTYIFKTLNELKNKYPLLANIRGKGLHIGISIKMDAGDFVQECLNKGLLLNATNHEDIRIMPPLNITIEQAKEGLSIIEETLAFFTLQQ